MINRMLGSRASIGGVLGSGRGGAAAALWWLSGGVSAANAIAVYQPIGAASLAASYVNLANPGTFDAAPGVAPAFDTATGWAFAAASTQYLTTGVAPADGWTAIVRYSDVTVAAVDMVLIGSVGASEGARFYIYPISASTGAKRYYGYGSAYDYGGNGATNGVIALAGNQAYYNSVADKTLSSTITTTGRPMYIGARNVGFAQSPLTGKIQAVAIYNTTLTAPQVAAISAAMAAL